MILNLIKKGIPGVLSIVLLMSCEHYTEMFNEYNMDRLSPRVEINPELAVPLAYGSFSLQDILENMINDTAGFVSIDDEGLIYISYESSAFSIYADEVIQVPDHLTTETYIETDINIAQWTVLPIGQSYTFRKIEKMDFAIEDDDRIDSLIIKSGDLILSAYSEFHHSGDLNITSSNIIDPFGDTLDITFEISQVDGSFQNDSIFDLTGWTLTMEEINDSAVVVIHFNLTLVKSDAAVAPDEEAGISMTFENIQYKTLFGFIAERSISTINESLEIDFFNTIEEVPDVYFADPAFNIAAHNSFGVPITLDIQKFTARSHVDGSFMELIFKNDTMNPFLIRAPLVEQIGQTFTTERFYNVATCNIDELLSSIPDKIDLDMEASTGNPPGSTIQNFVMDTSKLAVDAEVLLPLYLKAEGYTLLDTLDISIDSLLQALGFVESIHFRLTTTNRWPLGIEIQVYFVDELYTYIDSLFDEKTVILEAAPVDDNGDLDESRLETHRMDVYLPSDRISKLENARRMMLEATVSTTRKGDVADTVKFYSTSFLDYQLSVEAEFSINPDEMGNK